MNEEFGADAMGSDMNAEQFDNGMEAQETMGTSGMEEATASDCGMSAGDNPSDGGMNDASSGMDSGLEMGATTGMDGHSGMESDSGMAATPGAADGSDGDGLRRVLVELRVSSPEEEANVGAEMSGVGGFVVDPDFDPVSMPSQSGGEFTEATNSEDTVIVRGTVDPNRIDEIEARADVVKVWNDSPIAPFSTVSDAVDQNDLALVDGFAACPIGTCDCASGTPKGTLQDVAKYLGADNIWVQGIKGDGIVVGVVDGGITAIGRTPKPGETAKIPRVIGGHLPDWGTTARAWGDHGNMCATDVLGLAPNAKVYDLRISAGGISATISAALAAFQWAINRYRQNGTPQVLTNSWGIFQETWDATYARNPNHPFTRKVVEAVNEGIIVLFAAGNCGGTCPSGRCGSDSGPGKSIWGANGHPAVITVGAVNKNEQFVGYSSQGPAALDPRKPDFCSITHFKGYFNSDSGTSAATPVAAGVVALLRQSRPSLTTAQAKQTLMASAKNIGQPGWDQHSGAGIIQAKAAFDLGRARKWRPWKNLGGVCSDGVGVSSWAPNRLDCFTIGVNRAMYHKWWNGGTWSRWGSLGGECWSAPAAVSWGRNRIDTFVLGRNRAMYHKWWDGGAWRGWENLGGVCSDGVAVSSWARNRLDCFVIGTDRALWHKWWDGRVWRGWEKLGGECWSAPAAVSWGPNRIDVFVIGRNRAMWHKWWDGRAWRGWENLGGVCSNGVAVSSWAPNRLDCFVTGTDRAMWHKWWDGRAWRGWEKLGGECWSAPAAVSQGSNQIDTFVLGRNRAVYEKSYS